MALADVSIHDIKTGDILKLCKLFNHVVRHLPLGTTVFCFINAINEYEREEYLHTMDLIRDGSAAHFKLLLTSPRPTDEVRNVFDERTGTLLHMQQFPFVEDCMGSAVLQQRLRAEMENGSG
jgi:hypothetical protein